MNGLIEWYKYEDTQIIVYMQNGTFPPLKLNSTLFINETMDEFALGLRTEQL